MKKLPGTKQTSEFNFRGVYLMPKKPNPKFLEASKFGDPQGNSALRHSAYKKYATPRIMTVSITTSSITLCVMFFLHYFAEYHYAECHCAECRGACP